jgi:superfamily II DNA or RNA helicase
MIEENWLTDVIFTTVEIKADLTKVGTGANGDFQSSALSKAINTDETNELVIKAWHAKAKDRTSTLIFCVDLSHVTNLTARLGLFLEVDHAWNSHGLSYAFRFFASQLLCRTDHGSRA